MNKDDKLSFQIIDWDHFEIENDEGEMEFFIRLFGRDKQQKSVYLEVSDFKPYFYIELKDTWKATTFDQILTEVKKKVKKEHAENLIKFNIEEKYKFWGFTNYKKFKFAKLTFNSYDAMKTYARVFSRPIKVFSVSKYWLNFKLYESNILPVLRFMHIRQLEAVGWVSVDGDKLEKFTDKPTCNEINYKTKWQNVQRVEDRLIEKFVIASFDIECTSEDGTFPQPNRPGDKVIQIGVTLSRYGEPECYEKHLLGLKKTANIEGANVEWFETEEDLLLGFTKLIRRVNPDILTGYNIFGFDFSYLMERAKFLDIEPKFSRLSRVTNEPSKWVEQNLSSAALGTNILKYYKMTGRVIIDLMKVIQRDHKLSSYKLDYVASYFIREEILKLDVDKENCTFKIKTKKTDGLYKGSYVTITYAEGPVETKYNDGEKFEVIELGKDFVVFKGYIDTNEFMNKGYKIYWCQAKDDVSPNDIFRLFKGSAEDRAIIGKYCLMDCALCNKLLDKLQIVTNNVSMANVCNVPLSYLFLRGQGVKIFSLVAKKCREREHLIPVIQKKEKKKDVDISKLDPLKAYQMKMDLAMENFIRALNNKNKDEEEIDDDDDVGYEGAIVFPPKPGVYFEPVTVLDYASLYPNSMILRNLSHETWVNDPQYDNLPGYRYHTISYKVFNKEEQLEKEKEKNRKTKKPKIQKTAFSKDSDKNENDGEPEMVTCRFAEKLDGSKGIIPEILNDLLSARKKYKKMMETEKDPFLKGILESLQLAFKVVANSLYGQTGASTSPICMKEIAASTTATGREMLQFSKYFIEFIYNKIINLALDNREKFVEEMENIFQYFPTEIEYDDINRSNNEVTKVNVHVCTDHNRYIHDSKFIRQGIGYEAELVFREEFNDFFTTMKAKYSNIYNCVFTDVLEKGKPTGEITFGSINKDDKKDNNIVYQMFLLKVTERDEFYKDIKKYVFDKKGTSETIFNKYSTFWKGISIEDSSKLKKGFLQPIQNLDSDLRNTFIKNLEILVDETGYNGKQEMFTKFYNFVNKFIKGYHVDPEVIYGDSVTGDSPLLLKDSTTGKTFVTRIDKLCDKWEKYEGFKTNDANEYFIDIVKQLVKPDVKLVNERDSEKQDIKYLTKWKGGKYTGCISTRMNKGVYTYLSIYRYNKKQYAKQFSTQKYGEEGAKKMAEDYLKKINEDLDLIKNKYRLVQDKKNNSTYVEVKIGDKIMICDPDDLDIVENNYFCYGEGYALTDKNRFHRMVLSKLLSRLPKKVKILFDSFGVDHINGNTLDNRKCNLRYITQKHNTRNVKVYDTNKNKFGINGLDKHRKKYRARFCNFNGNSISLYFDDLEDAKEAIDNNNKEVQKEYKKTTDKFVKDIQIILKKDHSDRQDKEQSKTNYLVWSGKEWTKIKRVIRHKTNKKIFRVATKTSVIDVTEDHSLIDTHGNYIRPKDCSDRTLLMQSFPKNINGDDYDKKYDQQCFMSKDKAECMEYIAKSKAKGYNVIICSTDDDYLMNRTKEKIDNDNEIIQLKELKNSGNEYVYDLETENGKFHTGIGELIVKNTDSVFYCHHFTDNKTKIKLKDKNALKLGIFCGIWASILIGTLLPSPMSQEYEKNLFPLVLQGKKRYVGNLYEKDPDYYKQKIMGLETKRRDNAPIVKYVLNGIVDQILNKHSAEGAYEFVRTTLQKIITGGFKMDKFIITKTLKGNALTKPERKLEAMKPKEQRSYANRFQIVHAVLADRMADRDPGNKPLSNDRIPYVYIETNKKVDLQGERVETPDFIIKNKLKMDYLFYITNQIKKPSLKFLDLILENAESLFAEFEIKEKNRKDCIVPINYYLEKNNKEMESNEQDYYLNYDGSENKKNKKIDNRKELVNFDNLMEVSNNSKDSSDDEAPKKRQIRKIKKVTKDDDEAPKKVRKTISAFNYGDLLSGMDECDNENATRKKPIKIEKTKEKSKEENKNIKKKSPSLLTFGELMED